LRFAEVSHYGPKVQSDDFSTRRLNRRALLAHDLLCSVLRGDAADFPAEADDAFAGDVLALAGVHGVQALLRDRLGAAGAIDSWPSDLVRRLDSEAKAQAARELLVKHEVVALLRGLADAGVATLLLKGMPLAYTLYPQAYLRARCDTDMLIPESQRGLAHEVLADAGYAADWSHRRMVSYQADYSRRGPGGVAMSIDLHWRVSNLQYFAWAFAFDELSANAAEVPALCPDALAPEPVYALLIACMHRATNVRAPGSGEHIVHRDPNRLIWLYDIHLLCESLSDPEWARFLALAGSKGIRAICLDGLTAARSCLGTRIPASVPERLAAPGSKEISAGYLRGGFLRPRLVDLRSLPDWRRRLDLLSDWILPSTDHMMARYHARTRWLLPALYLRRGGEILLNLVRPHRSRG
jgi:hypothetical protein